MTQTVGSLVVDLELLGVGFDAKLAAAMAKTGKFDRDVSRNLGNVRNQARLTVTELGKLNTFSFAKMSGSLATLGGGLRSLAAGAGIGLGAAGAQKLIDATTRIDNALKVAGLSGRELDSVYKSLYASAQRTATPVESLVTLFGRASLVQKELGVSTQELLKFTGNVATALQVSGKSAQEASGALLQLSQALGSSVVRSEELNSLMEGALPIVQAAAAGLDDAGGSVARLRQLVVDGRVSSKAFFNAFQAGAVILQDRVANAQLTVSQGFTRLNNAAIDAARRINETAGVSTTAASALEGLAFVVNRLGDAFTYLAKQGGESGTTKAINDIAAAARNVVNDPSFENLYRFLFDASKARDQAALTDGIKQRAAAIDLLRQSMQAANEVVPGGAAATPNKRIDESFAAFAPKKVKLSDFPVTGDKETADKAVESYTKLRASAEARVASLAAEQKALTLTLFEAEKLRFMTDALNQANRRAVDLSPTQRAELESLATQYAGLSTAIEAAKERQELFKSSASAATDSMKGFITDLVQGKDKTEALANALKRLADRLLDLTLDAALNPLQKALSGGLNSLFGSGGASVGGAPAIGVVGSAGSMAVPTFFKNGGLVTSIGRAGSVSAIKAMAEGGKISGPGGPRADSILARLSNGEFVVNAAATKKHLGLLEAINSGINLSALVPAAFARGGLAGMTAMSETCFVGHIGGKGEMLQ
jgi:tape measure domain-containing protein